MTAKTLLQLGGADLSPPPLSQAAIVVIDAQREYVDGALPLPQQAPPEPQLGLLRQVKEVERLTVRAAVESDRDAALAAFAGHPLVASEELAQALLEGYEREFPALRDLWRPAGP